MQAVVRGVVGVGMVFECSELAVFVGKLHVDVDFGLVLVVLKV